MKGVFQVLSDGRTLFADLNESFDGRSTGLVGRNGVGKTILASIESGSRASKDFDAVGDRRDMRQRLRHELERRNLGHLWHSLNSAIKLSLKHADRASQ